MLDTSYFSRWEIQICTEEIIAVMKTESGMEQKYHCKTHIGNTLEINKATNNNIPNDMMLIDNDSFRFWSKADIRWLSNITSALLCTGQVIAVDGRFILEFASCLSESPGQRAT